MVVGNGILICVGVGFGLVGGNSMVGLWVGVGQLVAVAAAWWKWVLYRVWPQAHWASA